MRTSFCFYVVAGTCSTTELYPAGLGNIYTCAYMCGHRVWEAGGWLQVFSSTIFYLMFGDSVSLDGEHAILARMVGQWPPGILLSVLPSTEVRGCSSLVLWPPAVTWIWPQSSCLHSMYLVTELCSQSSFRAYFNSMEIYCIVFMLCLTDQYSLLPRERIGSPSEGWWYDI